MRQVKIFKTVENELWSLEKEINTWIKESGANVISISGNMSPQGSGSSDSTFSASDVLVVILYDAPAAQS